MSLARNDWPVYNGLPVRLETRRGVLLLTFSKKNNRYPRRVPLVFAAILRTPPPLKRSGFLKNRKDECIAELDMWLVELKPFQGAKHVKIFEHTLSQDASFLLKITDVIELGYWRYGRYGTEKIFETLLEAANYIQKYHWYGD